MSVAEYGAWIENSLVDFAAERAAATGMPTDVSLDRARAQLPQLLPRGQATAGMWFLVIVDPAGTDVGSLWLGLDAEQADTMFVWDLSINAPFRRTGLGRAAMIAAEEFGRQVGATSMGLNVFGSNTVARQLYESVGYTATSVRMAKTM